MSIHVSNRTEHLGSRELMAAVRWDYFVDHPKVEILLVNARVLPQVQPWNARRQLIFLKMEAEPSM